MRYLAPMKPQCIPAVALPLEHCMYCWYVLHPTMPYPESWSSTCCSEHSAWIMAQYARIRALRKSEVPGSVHGWAREADGEHACVERLEVHV
jgi:hypothetical protein